MFFHIGFTFAFQAQFGQPAAAPQTRGRSERGLSRADGRMIGERKPVKMAKLTILFGIVLILLGGFGYVATGSHAHTALIPSYVGAALAILGFFAYTPDAKRRMLFMHIAVTIGLLGFLFTFKGGIIDYILMLDGRQFPHPAAVEEKAAMSVLLLVFVILCVRSFVAARRARA